MMRRITISSPRNTFGRIIHALSLVLLCTTTTEAFTVPSRQCTSSTSSGKKRITTSSYRSPVAPLFESKDEENDNEKKAGAPKKSGFLPFFSRMIGPQAAKAKEAVSSNDSESPGLDVAPAATAVISEEEKPIAVKTVATTQQSPADFAKSLREQAERARLEAERMDAELTLSKIERLEKQLAQAKAKGDSVDDFQRQMDNLQAKLRGEAPKPILVPKPTPAKKPAAAAAASATKEKPKISVTSKPTIDVKISDSGKITSVEVSGLQSREGQELISGEDLEEIKKNYDKGPGFIKKIIASMVEMDYNNINDINSTELALRTVMMKNGDFSYSSLPRPTFTESQIDKAAAALKEDSWEAPYVTAEMVKLADANFTLLALYGLEHDYYTGSKLNTEETAMAELGRIAEGEDWLKGIIEAVNQTAVDSAIKTLYPKCTRKEDEKSAVIMPTQAQVQLLCSSVLPQAKFSTSGKPESVLGGYIIRGSHKYEKGDDLIAAIDKALAKTNLKDKMTIVYAKDFSVFAGAVENDFDMEMFDMDDVGPILYVLGPDITREGKRVALTVASAAGIATSWYLAIYPFLLNSNLGKRIDEQLGLAEAGMPYDLDWLTELSIPLFISFLVIQLSHELAHRLVAAVYDMKITLPTFVPSLITGTTSTVTTFKAPPPNKDALFDFSIAGPLAGLLMSVAAVVVGSQLTLLSDPATLPALPLEILRQSTLGGTIINDILGNGVLTVSEGARGTQAVAGMVIPLHPMAIAGYVSLFVNALALLPIGTTDGGRMAMCLFGRDGKLLVGNLAMSVLLVTGLLGSDLFLFYFAFAIAFQTGNEIPARNEVDPVSFSRVIAALTSFVVALLVLVPFQ